MDSTSHNFALQLSEVLSFEMTLVMRPGVEVIKLFIFNHRNRSQKVRRDELV
jgi:hypothetical protein